MIVSASRRTDIPALYARWLRRRLAAGYVRVPHPFRPSRIRTVDLRPPPDGSMDVLVLWTRDPSELLKDVPQWESRGIRTLWLVTVTGYPKELEPNVPPLDRVARALRDLANLIGKERIAWRYDPVIHIPALGIEREWHIENAKTLAQRIAPWVCRCIISLYDHYKTAERRLERSGFRVDHRREIVSTLQGVAEVVGDYGVRVQSCCDELGAHGIPPGGCIDGLWIDHLWGLGVGRARDPGQRPSCRCAPSVDIGVYNTCCHGCLYCYAVRSLRSARVAFAGHDPEAEVLA